MSDSRAACFAFLLVALEYYLQQYDDNRVIGGKHLPAARFLLNFGCGVLCVVAARENRLRERARRLRGGTAARSAGCGCARRREREAPGPALRWRSLRLEVAEFIAEVSPDLFPLGHDLLSPLRRLP